MAQEHRQGFVRYWLPVLLYVILIFTLSSIPKLAPPFHFPNSDKLAQSMEYAILGLLVIRALRTASSLQPVTLWVPRRRAPAPARRGGS